MPSAGRDAADNRETISTATSELQALPQSCSPIPRTWLGRMRPLGALFLAALLTGAAAPWPDEPSRTCFFQMLSGGDSLFCRGDLEVIYPELGDVSCSYIPKCHQYRERISREWGSPRVRYPQADKSKKYVLMLVDPDVPSRANPRSRFWRHWLVTDIPEMLKKHCFESSPPPLCSADTGVSTTSCAALVLGWRKAVLVNVVPDFPFLGGEKSISKPGKRRGGKWVWAEFLLHPGSNIPVSGGQTDRISLLGFPKAFGSSVCSLAACF
ncbi:phosphatidylethanolamine-binding protein 4 isoform X3 [Pezoporus flaviventris]|uniref:phosphatidylethanolamine-binding protein 4 isoform X3 n=1 Tax=Pezoporus flaviventris TaxID=889875 RepID=UPI002AB0DFED|nr:phosphatidylethanolamine-binding protein 4 isoform X3 [Pezoporus flaviventris]